MKRPAVFLTPLSSRFSRSSNSFRMTSLSNSVVISRTPAFHLSSSSSLKPADQYVRPANSALSFKSNRRLSTQRRALTIQASYSDDGRPSSGSIFVSGFVLGGLIVGTLGCVYAPQITKALTGTDKKDLMKKLPKFIYDEEKALEKQRKKLAEKIAQLNDAIDNVSTQLRSEEAPNGAAVSSDDIEALI